MCVCVCVCRRPKSARSGGKVAKKSIWRTPQHPAALVWKRESIRRSKACAWGSGVSRCTFWWSILFCGLKPNQLNELWICDLKPTGLWSFLSIFPKMLGPCFKRNRAFIFLTPYVWWLWSSHNLADSSSINFEPNHIPCPLPRCSMYGIFTYKTWWFCSGKCW